MAYIIDISQREIQKLLSTPFIKVIYIRTFIFKVRLNRLKTSKITFTNDGGTTWLTQKCNTSYDLAGLYFINDSEGWVVGRDGIILHTKDSGSSWLSQDSDVDENLNSVYFKNNMEGWVAGDNGIILHTLDGGVTWQRESSGTDKPLYDISYIKGYGLIAIGAECTIVKRAIDEP